MTFRRDFRTFEQNEYSKLKLLLRDAPVYLDEKDESICTGDPSSEYSVKNVVKEALESKERPKPLRALTRIGEAPPRVQVFLWCALKERILIRCGLKHRGIGLAGTSCQV